MSDDRDRTDPMRALADPAPTTDAIDPSRPAPPDALAEAGRELWAAIIGDLAPGWELDERERAVLAEACRLADTLAALDAAIEAEGATVKGSRGQTIVHPAIAEARQHRIALARLLGTLGLAAPASGAAGGVTAASQRASKAAQARWGTGGRRDQGRLV